MNVTGGTVSPFASVLLDGTSSWSLGDTVSITGFALPLVDFPTQTGTFTFDIRQGAGGGGASFTSGLSSLGTATATFTSVATSNAAGLFYTNFDTPVTFAVDANSTSIVINWSSTGNIRYKKTTTGSNLPQVNYSNGNFVGTDDSVKVSVAGSVVPEPSSTALLGLGGLALVLRRRR
ncbi:MAG: PEP-CTERM sorting domain-containing protein [Akkermansiaceae bacterium]|nr:PEP-CTERM sorting domain-containing protein [Akkermansiaceae bacterium]